MFRKRTNIDFISYRKIFGVISAIIVVVSLGIFFSKGLNYGIDFAGGTEVQLKFSKNTSPNEIRQALATVNLQDAMVQSFGDVANNEFLIRVPNTTTDPQRFADEIRSRIETGLAGDNKLAKIRFSGDKAYAKFAESVNAGKLLERVQNIGEGQISIYNVVPFGKQSDFEYLINFSSVTSIITKSLTEKFGNNAFDIRREDSVGPKVGKELRQKGVAAILVALIFILVYIWIRFDMNFAPGAIVALLHDVVITVGVFSFLQRDVNLSIIAALLTIVGYSLNDTIVVYDRIRENIKKYKGKKLSETVNISVNQTLSRTLMTSITTLLVTMSLMIFGGAIIFNFALALTLGVFVGTYSSIFVASPMMIWLAQYNEKRRKRAA